MRIVKWLAPAGVLVALVLATSAYVRHALHVSWSYGVEARFDSMPPNDKQLSEWLRAQPGVVPHTVGIDRFEPDGRLLRVNFIQSRNLSGDPPFPSLDGQAASLGYLGLDGPFRDATDRTRAITMD